MAITATSSAKAWTRPVATASPSAAVANSTGASTCNPSYEIEPVCTATDTCSGRRSPNAAGTEEASSVAGPRPSRARTAAPSAAMPSPMPPPASPV